MYRLLRVAGRLRACLGRPSRSNTSGAFPPLRLLGRVQRPQRTDSLNAQVACETAHVAITANQGKLKVKNSRLTLQERQVLPVVQCRAVVRHQHDRRAGSLLQLCGDCLHIIAAAGIDGPAI